jgi:hypothetical protein
MPPPPIELHLGQDRPRRFALTPTDWRDAARRLSAIADRHVNTTQLLGLIGQADYDALSCVLWAGCRAEDDRLTPERMWQALDRHLQSGKDIEEIAVAILKALKLAGIIRDRPKLESENGATRGEALESEVNPPPPATSSSI